MRKRACAAARTHACIPAHTRSTQLRTRVHPGAAAQAEKGHADTALLLLDRGAAVTAKSDKNETALLLAAYFGHGPVIALLLERGAAAQLEVADSGGQTPLLVAAMNGHSVAVSLLLAAGASIRAVSGSGDSALTLAALHRRMAYAPRAVQFYPDGGQFDFVRLPARTMYPLGAYVR